IVGPRRNLPINRDRQPIPVPNKETNERDKEEEPISELEDKSIILRVKRTKPNNTIEALYIKRDKAIAYRDIAIREYSELTFYLLNL
ncbi:uncharacterized protein N7525_005230, partial [Penicillium rubens]|uniref:uncharacterized protein n=1 Tax=Penicillium rubens TaxID=1108849 RepID=UPI002A59CAB7